jgi:hypothetical protein
MVVEHPPFLLAGVGSQLSGIMALSAIRIFG